MGKVWKRRRLAAQIEAANAKVDSIIENISTIKTSTSGVGTNATVGTGTTGTTTTTTTTKKTKTKVKKGTKDAS